MGLEMPLRLWELLPIPSTGPSNAPERCHRYARMGPEPHLGGATELLELAQHCACDLLPILSHGPSNASGRCHRYARMGPAMSLQGTADVPVWAQKCTGEVPRYARMGQAPHLGGATELLELAQHCACGLLPILLHGPSNASGRCHRYARMGPALCL